MDLRCASVLGKGVPFPSQKDMGVDRPRSWAVHVHHALLRFPRLQRPTPIPREKDSDEASHHALRSCRRPCKTSSHRLTNKSVNAGKGNTTNLWSSH